MPTSSSTLLDVLPGFDPQAACTVMCVYGSRPTSTLQRLWPPLVRREPAYHHYDQHHATRFYLIIPTSTAITSCHLSKFLAFVMLTKETDLGRHRYHTPSWRCIALSDNIVGAYWPTFDTWERGGLPKMYYSQSSKPMSQFVVNFNLVHPGQGYAVTVSKTQTVV